MGGKKKPTARENEQALSYYLDEAHEHLASAWVLAKRLRHKAVVTELDELLTKHTGPLAFEAEKRCKAIR